MATKITKDGRLFSLYTRYVGEPESRKDVYGYWLFLLGCCISFLGVLVYQVGPTDLSSPQVYATREISTTLAGIGLPVGLLGIVLMLPVKRRAMLWAVGGAGVALLGVASFTVVYPSSWVVTTPDYSDPVMAIYTVGVAIVAGVAALVPVVTGEKSLYFGLDQERAGEYPDVMVGRSNRGASFAVYRSASEWNWRLVEQSALAGNADGFLSRLEAEERVDHVRSKVSEAGLLEIKHAAFRLYEAAEGRWRWLLMRDDGSVVADSGDEFDSRDAAAGSVSVLKEHGPDAPVIDIEGAAFDYYREGGDWHWRLVDEEREALAVGSTPHDDRSAVEADVEAIRDRADGAGALAIDRFGVELYDEADEWYWRLLNTDLDGVASSTAAYGSRGAAESAVYELLDGVGEAPIIDASQPGYEVYEASANTWRWRLVGEDDTVLAHTVEDAPTAATATESATGLKADAARADVVEIDDAAFEYYEVGDEWHWRLVTESREVVAESTTSFPDREIAAEGVETTKQQALAAELIDFENAAFQLYETDAEWRWRLIDEDGNVMADSGEEHASRDAAAASMTTLKQNAPDADLLEIETAAFELFHDANDEWNWRLVDKGGQTIGQGATMHPSRAAAKDAMDRLVATAENTESRAMERAAFQLYADGDDEWWWRFVHPNGTVYAESAHGFATRDEAETVIENRVRPAADRGPIYEVGTLAFRLVQTGGDDWRWSLIDEERHTLATSDASLPREVTASTVRDVRQHGESAPVFELQSATFLLAGRDDGWSWNLVDADHASLAHGPTVASARETVEDDVDRVSRLLPTAGTVDYEETAFEVYEDERWHWRLIDAEENVIAAGSEGYDSRAAAEEAIAALKKEVDDASILEIDAAAFELHEDGGEWRWRLLGEDGNELAESLYAYPSRREAREAMNSVKEFGGDAILQTAE